MDRLWIGYIIGAAACGITAAIAEYNGGSVWRSLLLFATITPVGIWIANKPKA